MKLLDMKPPSGSFALFSTSRILCESNFDGLLFEGLLIISKNGICIELLMFVYCWIFVFVCDAFQVRIL